MSEVNRNVRIPLRMNLDAGVLSDFHDTDRQVKFAPDPGRSLHTINHEMRFNENVELPDDSSRDDRVSGGIFVKGKEY